MKKKIFAGLLAVVMMALLAVPAMALTSYELFSGWEQDGYPEGVTERSKRDGSAGGRSRPFVIGGWFAGTGEGIFLGKS